MIHISRRLAQLRRASGITQEILAGHIGVSKAAVSKWESGKSCPDIAVLPILAAYFNVSVDALLDYQPQMDTKQIRLLYQRMCRRAANKPWPQLQKEWDDILRAHYSCWPLLNAGAQWLLNHLHLEGGAHRQAMLQWAGALCERTFQQADDAYQRRLAAMTLALLCLMQHDPARARQLLGDCAQPYVGDEILLLEAHLQSGDTQEAAMLGQALVYQHVIALLTLLSRRLALCISDGPGADALYRQCLGIMEAFGLQSVLANASLLPHLAAAQAYAAQNRAKDALQALARYCQTVENASCPPQSALRQSPHFDLVDEWLNRQLTLGSQSPAGEEITYAHLLEALDNPAFASLQQQPAFNALRTRMEQVCTRHRALTKEDI